MVRIADDAGELFDDDDLPDEGPPQPPISDEESNLVFDLDDFEVCYPGDLGSRPYTQYDEESNSDENSLKFRTPIGYLDLVRGEWYSDIPPEPVVIEFDGDEFLGDNHATIEFYLDGDEWKSGGYE